MGIREYFEFGVCVCLCVYVRVYVCINFSAHLRCGYVCVNFCFIIVNINRAKEMALTSMLRLLVY